MKLDRRMYQWQTDVIAWYDLLEELRPRAKMEHKSRISNALFEMTTMIEELDNEIDIEVMKWQTPNSKIFRE